MKRMIITGLLAGGSVFAFAQGNQANIKQNGTDNSHTVQQIGTNEKLTLVQGTAAELSTQSEANVVMSGMNDEVFIRQLGAQHLAGVDVGGESNAVDVRQGGFGQIARVDIIDGVSPTNNLVKINQLGEANSANVSIQGGEQHDFRVKQSGSDNIASIRQYYSSFNTFRITQDGASNEAQIQQESGRDGDQVNIKQGGDLNRAYVALADADAISPTRDNQAKITQLGSRNDATIEQKTPNDVLYTPDAPSEIALNEAIINQHGEDNTALLVQYGSENFGKIQQSGSLNDATLTQAGVGDMATIVQNGSGNVSMVSQGVALP